MDINALKKWLLVVLFFSLALNFGFVFMALSWKFMARFTPPPHGMGRPGPGPAGPLGPGPGSHPMRRILERMDLPEPIRDQVKTHLQQMDAQHRAFARQLFEQEKKVLALIGQPGDLKMDALAPFIETHSRVSKESAMSKAEHFIQIRRLLGREKAFYLISELRKGLNRSDKGAPRDKPRE